MSPIPERGVIMTDKDIRQILFDPINMTLTIFLALILGFLFEQIIINFNTFFISLIFLTIGIFFISLTYVVFQYRIVGAELFRKSLKQTNKEYYDFFYNNTSLPLLNELEWIEVILSFSLIIMLFISIFVFWQVHSSAGNELYNNTISLARRQSLENLRSFFALFITILFALMILTFNYFIGIFSGAKQREMERRIFEKFDIIIEKLGNLEKR